jgi:CheY-like chemotaxis protein
MAKILLVEDNEMNRDMLSRRLKKKGFDVVMAIDGKRGIEMAAEEGPDLILLDMSLPVMDGWDAAKHLKAKDKALGAGCDDYDTKPVDIKRLLEKIEKLLNA